jgi:uncharacterized protein (DUF2252 family)
MSTIAERIQAFNKGRDPHLLQLKYKLMKQDPFAFFRGTCHLFYEDWPANSPLNDAPPAWICGDLHLQNFGSYKGDNRLVYFGINDFDEAVLAPCTWDLARLLVSLLLAVRSEKFSKTQDVDLCKYVLDIYTNTLLKGRINTIDDDDAVGPVKDLLTQVERRQRQAFLDKITILAAGTRKLLINGTHTSPVNDAERAEVTALINKWGANHTNPQFFKVLDVAHRIAGIGSLGVERYVVLVEGKGSPNQNHLLDLKTEDHSSLEPYLKLRQPRWHSQAERVVTIQRSVQAMPPALLATVELENAFYVLRELQPSEDKVDLALFAGKFPQLERLGRTIAQVVAWGQFQSGGRQGSAIASELMDFAKLPHWHKALLRYAEAYAEKVVEDYREFCAALENRAL